MSQSVEDQPINISTLDRQTAEALERVVTVLLDEAAVAYLHGNSTLLSAFSIDPEQAKIISTANRRDLAKRIVKSSKQSAIRLSLDQNALAGIFESMGAADLRVRHRRELINEGASKNMLKDLGLDSAQPGVSYNGLFSGLRSTCPDGELPSGRPQDLTVHQKQLLNTYWDRFTHPASIDPIDHLIRSAQYLNVSVTAIWKYIMEDPIGDRGIQKPVGQETTPDWVFVMFFDWGKNKVVPLGKSGGRRGTQC